MHHPWHAGASTNKTYWRCQKKKDALKTPLRNRFILMCRLKVGFSHVSEVLFSADVVQPNLGTFLGHLLESDLL